MSEDRVVKHFKVILLSLCAGIAALLIVIAVMMVRDLELDNETMDISVENQESYVQYAYAIMDSSFGRDVEIGSVPELGSFERIYISLMNDTTLRCSWSGRADQGISSRTEDEVRNAVEECINDDRFGGVLIEEELDNISIVFNVIFNRQRVSLNRDHLERDIELGVHALEIRNGEQSSTFKESVPITKNYDLDRTLIRLCSKAGLPENCTTDPTTELYRYNTVTFRGDRDGNVTELYRYNPIITLEDVNESLIRERLELAAAWLVNNIDSSTGVIEYEYQPSTDKYSEDINHIRVIATIWAMAELDEYTDEPLDSYVADALDYYRQMIICDDDMCRIETDDGANIAYSAFIMLTLLNLPDEPDRDSLLLRLANGIIGQQRTNGSFAPIFGSDDDSNMKYYPGEAMLALMRLYEETADVRHLTAVELAFPYYRSYWRQEQNTAMVPWHSQALTLLYEETGDEEIPAFIFEMNDWLIDNHQLTDSVYPDLIGGMPKPLPRNSTSAYMEGINEAYRLARLVGDEAYVQKYGDAIRLGTRFILQTQYTADNTFYVADPTRAIGGFRHSLESNTQRIDYTQHAVMALMKTLKNEIFLE